MPKTPTGITIGIKQIKLLHFELTSRTQEIKKQPPDDGYEFQFELQWNVVETEKLFNAKLSVSLYEKQSIETNIELAKMKVLVSFTVVNFSEVVKKKNNTLSIPDQLVSLTSGIVVSTARGMFAISVKESIINNAIIPIINPQVFIPKKVSQ